MYSNILYFVKVVLILLFIFIVPLLFVIILPFFNGKTALQPISYVAKMTGKDAMAKILDTSKNKDLCPSSSVSEGLQRVKAIIIIMTAADIFYHRPLL